MHLTRRINNNRKRKQEEEKEAKNTWKRTATTMRAATVVRNSSNNYSNRYSTICGSGTGNEPSQGWNSYFNLPDGSSAASERGRAVSSDGPPEATLVPFFIAFFSHSPSARKDRKVWITQLPTASFRSVVARANLKCAQRALAKLCRRLRQSNGNEFPATPDVSLCNSCQSKELMDQSFINKPKEKNN